MKRLERLRQAGHRVSLPNRPEKSPYPFYRARSETPRDLFTLRRALPSDVRFLEDLSARVFGLYGPYGEIVSRWFESGAAFTCVAFRGDRPAGFAMIGRPSSLAPVTPMAELLAIAVEPLSQGLGAGKLLMGKMEETALRLHVRRLFLHTAAENTRAQRLFAGCGYSAAEVKPGFYPEGQGAILMFKDLS
jgi:ribosomal-protein-alanine N-acetyltransferase